MTGQGANRKDALAVFCVGVSLLAGGRIVADRDPADPALDQPD